jgi:hypothetical protein
VVLKLNCVVAAHKFGIGDQRRGEEMDPISTGLPMGIAIPDRQNEASRKGRALFQDVLSGTKVVRLGIARRQRLRIDPASNMLKEFIGECLDRFVKSGFGGKAIGVHIPSPQSSLVSVFRHGIVTHSNNMVEAIVIP